MTLTIIIAIVAFLVITLALVGLLLFAKAKLTTSGDVTIDINGGEKVLIAESGGTLLSTLANNNVFLPSACGGGGSCGMCKCQVLEGGGELLPTETGFINRKMAKEHWRLGCQVKVKENLKIHVPESVLGVKKWECEVISNRNISTFLKEFVVKLPEGENLKFRSGGYIQIDIPKYDAIKFSDMDIEEPYREDWDKMKMWDLVTKNPEPTFRAYSMANHPAEGNIIMLNIRIATPPFDRATGTFAKVNPGICSSYIFSRKPGDKVTFRVLTASSSCLTTCPRRRSWYSSAAVQVWHRCAATSCTCSRPRRLRVPYRSGTAPARSRRCRIWMSSSKSSGSSRISSSIWRSTVRIPRRMPPE